MTNAPAPVRRALISVSDKTGLIDRAQRLSALGAELVSTGGTAKALKEAGLAVKDVSELTGFPEMMDGRVKTLHPGVHGGLLARRDDEAHMGAAREHGIAEIDLLWVNLYPFEETLARGADFAECVENIDIGGPAMIRAAAKNHDFVTVCVEGEDVDAAMDELEAAGGTSRDLRIRLAAKAYARTGAYDAAISNWMAAEAGVETPDFRAFGGRRKQALRYGENPHQAAGFYVGGPPRAGVATARQAQGKALSFINLYDANAAFELAAEFPPEADAACAIIKHANPCGMALGASPADAYARALRCDPVSAFGGIIAFNQAVDEAAALAVTKLVTDVVIAPDADEAALAVFAGKKNLRVLLTGAMPDPAAPGLDVRTVAGGYLVQDRDNGRIGATDLKIVTKRAPSQAETADMLFAWTVAKHVKSNAVVYAKDRATVGVGMGQTSRLDSSRSAVLKSADAAKAASESEPLVKGSVVASDAYFPFADGLLAAAEAGATAVIQPGGSMRDEEVIAAADEAGLAMAFTGMRHFRH